MPATKNLCAQISLELHQKISVARGESGLTPAQYITQLLTEYYEMKENGGKVTMAANNTRTMAFQIPETFFRRIKAHLERGIARTGRKLTRREFVLGLTEKALEAAEWQAAEDSPEPAMEEQPGGGADVSLLKPPGERRYPAPEGRRPRRVGRVTSRVTPRQLNSR